jgi:Nif-specific ferredoxin III
MATITGHTRGGTEWTPTFITALNATTCIGCGRCYKVCPRDVFELVDRTDLVEDVEDEDDEMKVMAIKNGLDCIGCTACAKVCPKNCHSHAAA